MKKISVFAVFLMFFFSLSATAQEGVIMLNSPEEIEQFKKLLEDKTLVTEEAFTVVESSAAAQTAAVETSSGPVKEIRLQPAQAGTVQIQSEPRQPQAVQTQSSELPPAEPGSIIILQSEEEIRALNEKISGLVYETYGTETREPQSPQK